MKTIIKNAFLIGAMTLGMASCGENSWNETYLPDFEVPPVAPGTTTVLYTLTDADYKTIANNSTNKSLASESGESDLLAAVATNLCFPTQEFARKYLPAFIGDSSFPYFNLNNGSSVKVSYNVSSELPEIVKSINGGLSDYRVTKENYIEAWGSDEDYIEAFAPSLSAAGEIPGILKSAFPQAEAGTYKMVNYKEAATNPIFGGSSELIWEETNVVSSLKVGENATVMGVVTALSEKGFVLTDKGGSVLVYQNSGFDVNSVKIGSQVILTGKPVAYQNCIQFPLGDCKLNVGEETSNVTYPAPEVYTGALMDKAVADFVKGQNNICKFASFTGKLSISGSYYNITVDGASKSTGSILVPSPALKAKIKSGETYTFTGYYTYISGKYFYLMATDITPVTKSATTRAQMGEVVTSAQYALYQYDGSSWAVPENTFVLQDADYVAMGESRGNLSGTLDDTLLPLYLKNKAPYAAEGDAYTVVYKYYANSNTAWKATQFIMTDGVWVKNMGFSTDQFTRKDNVWSYNPSVELVLEKGSEAANSVYYGCVDWVYENISLKMEPGCQLKSAPFIDYRANAEYYSGSSAYYGNVDVRATTATGHMPEGYTGYDGLSSDEISMLVKKRFTLETLPGTLEKLYSDMAPAEGMEVTYSVKFISYDGTNSDIVNVYKVIAKGKLQYVSSTWFKNGEDKDWQ